MSIVIKFILYRLKRNNKGKESETFFLNTNFFTTLRQEIIKKETLKEELKIVVQWTKNKNIFSKKLIFIPINKSYSHWSLCVVVNPGKFTKKDKVNGDDDEFTKKDKVNGDDDEIPYILLFDSILKQNRNTIKSSICQWLKVVYEKEKNIKDCDMFNDLPLYADMNSKFNIFKFITQVIII